MAILVAILAAILDLHVTCMLDLNFCGFIVSGMVKNIYIDSNIVALTALLALLDQFFYIFHRFGSHFGGHFGGHIGFTGQLNILCEF